MMTRKEVEARVRTAVEHAAPDLQKSVLSSCEKQGLQYPDEQRKGTVIDMKEMKNSEKGYRKRRTGRAAALAAAAVAVCACAVLLVFGMLPRADSVIMLDVNPSLSLTVDARERVLSAEALNEDAKEIIGSMKLKGTDLEVALNALIGSMLQKGYLGALQNSVLVSVENQDEAKGEQLQQKVSQAIASAMQSQAEDAAVLSQTVHTDDTALNGLAAQYGISVGKAALIREVIAQDNTLTFEALSPMTINEIALIAASRNVTEGTVSQTGSASEQAYIGAEEAFRIACEHAGAAAEEVYKKEVEFDSEKGVMVYEVDFKTASGEYEYDINARTGEILKAEAERRTMGNAGSETANNTGSNAGSNTANNTGNSAGSNTGNGGAAQNQNNGGYIGEEAAKEAALAHAGVKAEDTQYINSWLDYEDGYPEHYEVEFVSGNTEYDYEIDLYTGAVLKSETESHKQHGNQEGGTGSAGSAGNTGAGSAGNTGSTGGAGSTGNTGSAADYIGEEAALNIALNHAGVARENARKTEVKLDRDDGITLYEVEFESGSMEYEYEIDAVSGAVLKAESDND